MPDVVLNQRLMITDGGGIAIRLINKTGGASVKGTVVSSDPSTPSRSSLRQRRERSRLGWSMRPGWRTQAPDGW